MVFYEILIILGIIFTENRIVYKDLNTNLEFGTGLSEFRRNYELHAEVHCFHILCWSL